jgi:hypothetical protein
MLLYAWPLAKLMKKNIPPGSMDEEFLREVLAKMQRVLQDRVGLKLICTLKFST